MIACDIAEWLRDNRAAALDEWQTLLWQHVGGLTSELPLGDCYAALEMAADGDPYAIQNGVKHMSTMPQLASQDRAVCLQVAFTLRRALRATVLKETLPTDQVAALLDSIDSLVEQAEIMLAAQWASDIGQAEQQLQHTEVLLTKMAQAVEEADAVALQVSNLNNIGLELTASLNRTHQIEVIGAKLMESLHVAHTSVWFVDGNKHLYLAGCWGECSLPPGLSIATSHPGDLVAQAYQTHTPQLAAGVDHTRQQAWHHESWGVFAIPIMIYERAAGVIVLQDPQIGQLSLREQTFVGAVAAQAALALGNANLYEDMRDFNLALEQRINERTAELQLERDMLETLRMIALEVGSTLDLDLLLSNCLSMLTGLMNVEHGSIMLIEGDTGHLVDRAVLGRTTRTGYVRFPLGVGIAGWVAQNGKPVLSPDVRSDSRWIELPETSNVRKRGGSMLAVPLQVQNEVLGVLLLSHQETNYFTDSHMRLSSAAAGEIALGIHNAMLFDQIQQQLMRQGEMLRNERRSTTQGTAILQSLSDGVIVCDVDGHVITVNPAAERLLGVSMEQLVTSTLPDVLTQSLGNHSLDLPLDTILHRPHHHAGEAAHYGCDFQIGPTTVKLTIDPVTTDPGEVLGAVAVFRDVTREVESDRLKDEFIGTVSHELRTPMTSIKGYTQLITMGSLGPVNDNQKTFLHTIHTNADRMISIINDLLDITKIEAGSISLHLQPVYIAEAISNVVLELQTKLQDRGHELSLNLSPHLPMVQTDPIRFNQVLSHLLANAIKYTPEHGRITVGASVITDEQVPDGIFQGLRPGRYVQIDVSDTGVGIEQEEQELVFQRFYRTKNQLTVEAGGTGLGLALVRSLMRLLGGRIWVQSEVDNGSTFSIIVPAA